MNNLRRAFTLVEILVVVIILGVLSAIVVPQFARATEDAARVGTYDQLNKIRRAIAVYYVRSASMFPGVTSGLGTWGELLSQGYLKVAPSNNWIQGPNAQRIVIGSVPDTSFHTAYGWIYNPATGDVWAGSFNASDEALPKP